MLGVSVGLVQVKIFNLETKKSLNLFQDDFQCSFLATAGPSLGLYFVTGK